MSTNEPPAGAAHEGTPEYGQPQDPWAGGFDYTPGQSSVPTDPIPHQYDPYQSYEGPYAGGPDPWGHAPTQGQPWMAPPKPSRAVPVLVFVIVLLIVGGGIGAAVWYFLNHQTPPGTIGPTAGVTTPADGGPTTNPTQPSPTDSPFDPSVVKQGDCLVNNGSNGAPEMKIVQCGPIADRDVYRVIKVVRGADIGQDNDGKLDEDEARAACAGTKFQRYYKNDFLDDSRDVVFCMTVEQ